MTKARKKLVSVILILSLFVGIAGVANTDVTYAASRKIHIKKKTVSIVVGAKYQQKLINKNGKTIKANKVKWKSLNKKVAKINKKGKITAVRKGTARMTAKYKGKTYKFTVKVKKASNAAAPSAAEQIYNYVKQYGNPVKTAYYLPGNRCIEFTEYSGSYTDTYVISIDTSDASKIYFGSYRVKPSPGSYDDTTETTLLTYNMGSKSGQVEFLQIYYSGSSVTSWGHYTACGIMTYANYSGGTYSTEQGITSVAIGDNRTPVPFGSYETEELIDGAKVMTRGVNKLLSQHLPLIRLSSIGFSKL